MIEAIVTGLIIYAGKKAMDSFWPDAQAGKSPVVNQIGNLGYSAMDTGPTMVGQELTVPEYEVSALVTGDLFVAPELRDLALDDAIPLVLVVEEIEQQALIFVADIDGGFQVYLPDGFYTFYVFLVDTEEEDLFDAEIYAVGASGDVPIRVIAGENIALNMDLIDTDEIPGFPSYFPDLLEDPEQQEDYTYDLTGSWHLVEEYEFGTTEAIVNLVQFGHELLGQLIIHDVMEDGDELVLQETVSGTVQRDNFSLEGTEIRALKGISEDYQLDRWVGVLEDDGTLTGSSEDLAGTVGVFHMERLED